MALVLAVFCLFPGSISIAPSALTFPEIGTELTKQGMPTEVVASLKGRAAVVSLHDRSPEQVRNVLSEGLGVSFVQRGGLWTMQEDPSAKERNRLLMLSYSRMTAKAARQYVTQRTQIVKGRSYSQFTDWIRQQCDAVKGKTFSPEESEAALLPLVNGIRLGEPAMWIGLSCFGRCSISGADLAGPVRENYAPSEMETRFGVPVDTYFTAAQRIGIAVDARSHLEVEKTFDPVRGEVGMEVAMYINGTLFGAQQSFLLQTQNFRLITTSDEPYLQFPVEMPTVKESFDEMGPKASTYLASLQTSDFRPSDKVITGEPSASLSVWLQRLCMDGQDAVMELSPRFDNLPGHNGWEAQTKMSLASLLHAVPDGPHPWMRVDREIAETLKIPSADDDSARKRRGERQFPWRVKDDNGVLVITNPFAFLDRAAPVSPVPYLLIERLYAVHPPSVRGLPLITIGDFERLFHEIRPLGSLERMASFVFRDLHVAPLMGAESVLAILDKLSPGQRTEILSQISRGENARFDVEGQTYIAQPQPGPDPSVCGLTITLGPILPGKWVRGIIFKTG